MLQFLADFQFKFEQATSHGPWCLGRRFILPQSRKEDSSSRSASRSEIRGSPLESPRRKLPDPQTDCDEYQALTIRPDGSFTAVITKRCVRKGTWLLEFGVIRLMTTNRAATSNGFRIHSIDYVDDHKLVCSIDISVAGRMKFTK